MKALKRLSVVPVLLVLMTIALSTATIKWLFVGDEMGGVMLFDSLITGIVSWAEE